MIDPETLTDEQLYVEIHTWHNVDPSSGPIRGLLEEAASRWMELQAEVLHREALLR